MSRIGQKYVVRVKKSAFGTRLNADLSYCVVCITPVIKVAPIKHILLLHLLHNCLYLLTRVVSNILTVREVCKHEACSKCDPNPDNVLHVAFRTRHALHPHPLVSTLHPSVLLFLFGSAYMHSLSSGFSAKEDGTSTLRLCPISVAMQTAAQANNKSKLWGVSEFKLLVQDLDKFPSRIYPALASASFNTLAPVISP